MIEVQTRLLGDLRVELRDLTEREVRVRPVELPREPFPRGLDRAARQPSERGMALEL